LPSLGALRCIACIDSCRRCGGKLEVIASIEDPAVINRILDHLRQWAETEQPHPAFVSRAPPDQSSLF